MAQNIPLRRRVASRPIPPAPETWKAPTSTQDYVSYISNGKSFKIPVRLSPQAAWSYSNASNIIGPILGIKINLTPKIPYTAEGSIISDVDASKDLAYVSRNKGINVRSGSWFSVFPDPNGDSRKRLLLKVTENGTKQSAEEGISGVAELYRELSLPFESPEITSDNRGGKYQCSIDRFGRASCSDSDSDA